MKYFALTETDSAAYYLNTIEDTVKLLNENRLTLYWTLNKVQQLNIEGKYDSVKGLLTKISNLSQTKEITKKDLLNFYILYDKLLLDQGLLDSAVRVSNQAYLLAKKIDTSRLATTSFDLFEIYNLLDDLPNMRKYLFEAWHHSNQEPELKGLIGNGFTSYYDRIGQLDSAIYYFKNFENDSLNLLYPDMLATMYENMGILLIKKGKLNEGFQYQLKAKGILDQNGIKNISTLINLGETFARLDKYDQAISYMDSALLLATPEKNFNLIKLTWKNKADLYANVHQYKQAHAALDSAYAYYNIEMDSSLRTLARELETKYTVRAKDDQINSLALSNQANLKIRSQQKVIIISMIVAMLLLSTIGVLLWRRRQLQIKLRETQLQQQLLRSQMEPHFIFNSLSVLQSFIRNEEKGKSINYLGQFSKLLRQMLENARESLVPFNKEVEALQNYLQLQSINFTDKFDYTVTIYNSWQEDEIVIPPMLIQPFVENAILHGISPARYKGKISIDIQKMTGSLHCIIEDNGIGLYASGKTKGSLATQITQERLSILARQTRRPAKLTITDMKTVSNGQGVRVVLDIPYRLR